MTSSNIATFADDTRIFETINSISDGAALQGDLSKLEEGSTNVNFELNASKCKVMRVTRKPNKIIYQYTARSMYMLHDTIIENTGSERDLGILTSYSLTCRAKHVEYQCAKASNTLGYIRRSPFDTKDIAVLDSHSYAAILWFTNLGTTNRQSIQQRDFNDTRPSRPWIYSSVVKLHTTRDFHV